MKPKLLFKVVLAPRHAATGSTHHVVANQELGRPVELRIVKYEGDTGYYLFYCDAAGNEMTDTYHQSIEEAQLQANFEFEVNKGDWIECSRAE